MQEAISAYKTVTATPEFKEAARLRERAKHNEASALAYAERRGRQEGMEEGLQNGRQETLKEVVDSLKNIGISDDVLNRILKI